MSIKYENGEEVQMIIKTVKESQSGLFTNQRLLLIKAGIVSYFSSIPKEFIGNYRAIELSGQIPKFTIAANEISKIQLKGNQLSLLVHKSKLIPRDDFQKLVKGNEDILKSKSSKQYNLDHNGYQLWIFKSQDQDNMLQFYRLVNMFRTGDPKFQPKLSSVVQGFQKKKAPRKTTIDPTQNQKINELANNRRSEIAKPQAYFQTEKKPEILPMIIPKQEPVPSQAIIPIVQSEPQIKKQDEQQRLKEVVEKIININQTYLQRIDQRTNQDQYSYLSKDRPIPIEVIKTFEDDYVVPEKINQDNIQLLKKQNKLNFHEVALEVINDLISNVQKIAVKLSQEDHQRPNIAELEHPRPKTKQQTLYSSRLYDADIRSGFEVREKKKRKINQLLKVATLNANHNLESVAKSVGMTLQELTQFIRINSIQEHSCWNFIQSELGKMLSSFDKQYQADYKSKVQSVTDELIQNYHQIEELTMRVQPRQMLEGQITVDNYQEQHEQDKQILRWMQAKLDEPNSGNFSEKVISSNQYRIAIRPLIFQKQQIFCVNGSWIVNKTGHLEEFLAYLHLERTLRDIQAKNKGHIQLECGDAIYLKYRGYQAIVKQLRIGYSYYPLKSIRALEYINKSKDIQRFYKAFPQFLISVQMIKQTELYRFHLDRITSASVNPSAIKQQLKRLVFPFDNELDLFFQSSQFQEMLHKCIQCINRAKASHRKITSQIVFRLLEQMSSNIQVDTICKLLGVRIDKQLNIQFQSTALRLGHRQFGEQLCLIRRARKSGDIQFSRNLSKRVMSRLQYYKWVTPVSNFIHIYLQLIDFMVIQKGQLHRAVSVLLKVVNALSEFQIQQYPVYLALMKTYLKLGEINNFIVILENSRLFLSQMFKERAIIFDFPFVRVLMLLAVRQDPKKGIIIIENLIQRLESNQSIGEQIKQKYISRAIWDKCNILFIMNEHRQAYVYCQKKLLELQDKKNAAQVYWSEGVLVFGKSWCEMEEVSPKSSAMLQKRLQRALEQSLIRQNFQMTFMLLEISQKVLAKCKEQKLPKLLQLSPSYQQARIEFNATREQMLELIQQRD